MVLIGAFNIISTLVMVVMEKKKDIAILRSMGATQKSIRKIFLLKGCIIGVVGTTLGVVLGPARVRAHFRVRLSTAGRRISDIDGARANLCQQLCPGRLSSLRGILIGQHLPGAPSREIDPVEIIRYE